MFWLLGVHFAHYNETLLKFPCAVVLSSDEEEEADNASTGSVNRLDSVSPRPADSAHSSPAPSGGKVEAAVKGPVEQQDELAVDYFTEIADTRLAIPRKPRMKDAVRELTLHIVTLLK